MELLKKAGVKTDPYSSLKIPTSIVSIIKNGEEESDISQGERAEMVLKKQISISNQEGKYLT